MKLEEIHNSLVNGQRKQMVKQIQEYGPDFWEDYSVYLDSLCFECDARWNYFTGAVTSYHRITNN